MSKALIFVALIAAPAAAAPTLAQAQDWEDAPATVVVGGMPPAEFPAFQRYIVERRIPSYAWFDPYASDEPVVAGDMLPDEGVTYYAVPPQYHVTRYRYTIINDEPVLVDPMTRRVVAVID